MNWKNAQRFRIVLALLAATVGMVTAPLRAAWLEWDRVPETNAAGNRLAGYRVYVGPSSRNYSSVSAVGNTNSFLLAALAPYQTYFMAVTAYDTEGTESDFSNEVSYTVPGPNRSPVSAADIYFIAKNQTLIRNAVSGVLANDSDPDVNALTTVLVSSTVNGSLSLDLAGGFNYTPTAGFVGQDSFTYQASDGTALSPVTTVTIVVTNPVVAPVNRPPLAANDQYVTGKDGTIVTGGLDGLLANDFDPDGDTITPTIASGPAHGQLSMGVAGGFTYRPATNYVGTDAFRYYVFDGATSSAIATVTITITNVVPPNRTPVAVGDQYVTAKNTRLLVNSSAGVIVNDYDPDGNQITAVLISGPAHGQLTLNSSGSFIYAPNTNYFGSDSFGYGASDGGATSAIATVTITITNTIAANRAPVANAEQFAIGKNQVLSVNAGSGLLVNDSDPDGNPITAVLAAAPSHGQLNLAAAGSFTYVPTADFLGSDSFAYRAFDGTATSSVATVTILVTNVAPIVTNHPPNVNADQFATEKNKVLTVNAIAGVLANDFDADGNTITATMVSAPAHGQMVLENSGAFVYLPATNFVGTDSFTYRAFDGTDYSGVATVAIVISNSAVIPDRAPIAVGEQYTGGKDTLLNVNTARGVLANDFDPDGNAINPVVVTSPAHGSLTMFTTGGFLYMPNAGFVGTDSFIYRASDGVLQSADATVTLVVTNAAATGNLPPTAVDDYYTVQSGNVLLVEAIHGVLANDSDPDSNALTAVVVSLPANGEVTVADDGGFRFTPVAGFVGTNSFTYRASDGLSVSPVVTVTISVTEGVPASQVTCSDCLIQLNNFVVAQGAQTARVAPVPLEVTSSNSLDEVVRVFTRVAKAVRHDPAANAQLLSVGHCLLTVLSNSVTARGEVVATMYPSQWSSAANKLVAALELAARPTDDTAAASRVLVSAVKNLKRLDAYILRSQAVPESLEGKTITFALSRSSRFAVTFGSVMFSAQDGTGSALVGTYSFAQTAWDQGTLQLNFISAPPATYNLQFRNPRGRVRGPVAKGTFSFVP